jgi:hypothetical protein
MAELEPIMGFFGNLLPMPLAVARDLSLADFTGQIKRSLLDAFSNQEVPFERLANEPEIAAVAQRGGIYQALFSFQDARARTRQWGAMTQSTILIFQKGATEDLGLWLMEVPSGLEGGFIYNADLYTADTARAFRSRYLELLNRVADRPAATVRELIDPSQSESARYLSKLRSAPAVAAAPAPERVVPPPVAVALSPAEQSLREVWANVLNVSSEDIQPTDNFFDLGGNSLLVMRAIEHTAREFNVRPEARRYFYETLAQLAATEPTAAAEPVARPVKKSFFKRVFAGFGDGQVEG